MGYQSKLEHVIYPYRQINFHGRDSQIEYQEP